MNDEDGDDWCANVDNRPTDPNPPQVDTDACLHPTIDFTQDEFGGPCPSPPFEGENSRKDPRKA